MPRVGEQTKVKWHEIAQVGTPPLELRSYAVGPNVVPRIFLCRGEWSIFTSRMHSDGSGFEQQEDDVVQAWAIIDGF
ncbi:MAG: hypothetical protein E6R08_01185 [Nevskiaceae bacterium]|nr:MAG: hypothetical protein E6R08_01185 [Nevskiaceae bacterium]